MVSYLVCTNSYDDTVSYIKRSDSANRARTSRTECEERKTKNKNEWKEMQKRLKDREREKANQRWTENCYYFYFMGTAYVWWKQMCNYELIVYIEKELSESICYTLRSPQKSCISATVHTVRNRNTTTIQHTAEYRNAECNANRYIQTQLWT